MRLSFVYIISLSLINCSSPILSSKKVGQENLVKANSQEHKQFLNNIQRELQLIWLQGPYGDPHKESVFLLILRDESQLLTEIDPSLSIEHSGWMPSMGHGTADDGVIEKHYDGVYFVRGFRFNMPGDWEIEVLFKSGESVVDKAIFYFEI